MYQAVGSEPGLLFWDIANDPAYHTPNFVTFYPEEPEFRHLLDPKPQDMEAFRAKQESVWAFIRHAIAHVREKDPVNALGVGNTYAYEIEPSQTAPLVDVLIFHNYFETRKRVRDECEIMKRLSQKYNKPVVNNECCCLCRSNPYDMELEILAEYGFGFYVFELMIGQSIWRKVHGICYPDGTVRDPSIVAAVQGFFRNRGPSAIPEDVNEEGSAHLAIRLATETLAKTADRSRRHMERENAELLLEAAEYIANLLEAGQYVPMRVPPTARIAAYRRQEHPNLDEIRHLGCTSWCSSCGRSAAFWAAAKATVGFNFYRGKSARTFGPGAFSFAACMGRRRQPVHHPQHTAQVMDGPDFPDALRQAAFFLFLAVTSAPGRGCSKSPGATPGCGGPTGWWRRSAGGWGTHFGPPAPSGGGCASPCRAAPRRPRRRRPA